VSDDRRIRRALRCYPKAWRDRYGDEFAALLTDTIEGGGRGIRMWWDVARGGFVARVETTGLVGDAAGVERRTKVGTMTAFCAAAVFVVALGFGALAARNWRNFPLDEQGERYGMHTVGAGMSDWAPWMRGAQGIPIAAADAVRIGTWAICAAVVAAFGLVIVAWIRSTPGGDLRARWHRWGHPALAVAGPAVLFRLATLVQHVQRTWLYQDDHWAHRFLGLTWNWWFVALFDVLYLGALVFAMVSLARLARGVSLGRRLRRVLRIDAAATAAAMTFTAGAVIVWVAGLYAQAPDVLRDRLPPNAPTVGGVGGPGEAVPGFGGTAIGLFGSSRVSTMAVIGLVLLLGLALGVIGVRRAASRPRHQLT
jgi:hypothetical protein